MVFISATRLRLRSIFYLPAFFRANEHAVKELLQMRGFIEGKELTDKGLTFWTLTMWESMEHMRMFRNSPMHRKAMQKFPEWSCEAWYVHWSQESHELPGWHTVYTRMAEEGTASKVRHPSKQHSEGKFPPPKWTRLERPLRPKTK